MKNAREVKEVVINRYIGIGTFKLLCLNPNKDTINKMLGTNLDKEPEYKSIDDNGNKQIRIDMYFEHVTEDETLKYIHKVAFFLKDGKIISKDGSKIKVINNYGNTTFLPITNFENNTVPENMSWYATPYKICYNGQEELINFLIAYFAIPSLQYKDNTTGEYKIIDKPENAEMFLEDIEAIINGDLTELKTLQDFDNKIKILVGIKKTEDNKVYQDTFIQHFIKVNTTNTNFLETKVTEAKNNSRYPNTEFEFTELHKYVNESTQPNINTDKIPTISEKEVAENIEDLPF